MADFGFLNVCATQQFWQQRQNTSPRYRGRDQKVESSVCIFCHRRHVKHATNPGAVADAGERYRASPGRVIFVAIGNNAHLGCGHAVKKTAQYGEQVHQVAYRPSAGTCKPRDFGLESYAETVCEITFVHLANVKLACCFASDDAPRKLTCRLLPVECDIASLGKVIACTDRDDAECGASVG